MTYDLETAMTDLHSPVSFGGGGGRGGGGGSRQERRNSFHQRRNSKRSRRGNKGSNVDAGTTVDVGRGLSRYSGGRRVGGIGFNESGPFCRDCDYDIPNSGRR